MIGSLGLIVLLLAAAVLVVMVFRSLHLPALIGYLLLGVLVGPSGFALAAANREINYLAEFGVVFLMFTIGLEFSLPRLVQMRRTVLGLGGLQVLLCGGLVAGAVAYWGYDWRAAFAMGAITAMSSTAITMRMLAERRELESPHGRQAFGVLLFQDLAVVPLLIAMNAFGGAEGELGTVLALALLKAALVLALILILGQRLMRGWFHRIAARRSNELFMLNVLLVTLGLSWITEVAGLSLALGAFLAGVLISETEYRHQVEEDIKPFRDVLLGLFFVTVGMQLDLAVVADRAPLVLVFLVVQLGVKIAVITALARLLRESAGTALRTALVLAQAGEFGLVLATLAVDVKMLPNDLAQPLLASMLLSMMLGPILIHTSGRIVMRVVSSEWMAQSLALHQLAVRSFGTTRHVVLCGYGRTGQSIARILERAGVQYIALDLDPDRVREAEAAGEPVVYGDASRRELMVAAGLNRASAVVITYADPASSLGILAHVRELRPNIPVIVRTIDDAHLDRLTAGGATEVVPDTFESSLMLASHALVLIGVPLRNVLHQVRAVRDSRYSLLRGFYHGQSDANELLDEEQQPRLHSVVLEPGSFAVGQSIADLGLDRFGVSVAAVRRGMQRIVSPASDTVLELADVVVLMGDAEGVSAAELRLLQGAE